MGGYRIYFRNADRIVGRFDFGADDEATALAMAMVLVEACSDRCDSVELWTGGRRLGDGAVTSSRSLTLEGVGTLAQKLTIDLGRAIQESQWPIADSETLAKWLDGLSADARSRA